METLTVIFDLDGTLALIDKRRSLATKSNGKLDWGIFFSPENICLDEPNIPVVKTFQAMKAAEFNVGIFSGRDSISRKETDKLLADGKTIMCAFDDRDKVVKMWRDNNISCFQVGYGNF
jgi:hypothetical protein